MTKGKESEIHSSESHHADEHSFQHHGHQKIRTQENLTRPRKHVKEFRRDEKANRGKKTFHISAQSPENNRRNAICEAIEKQCIDHVHDKEVNLYQRRDCLRVEYVLREVCLL